MNFYYGVLADGWKDQEHAGNFERATLYFEKKNSTPKIALDVDAVSGTKVISDTSRITLTLKIELMKP